MAKPKSEKRITLRFINEHHRLFPAIYKIRLGGKFYIGRANLPAERISQHETAINKALDIYERRKIEDIPPSEYKVFLSYQRWVKYLVENPRITEGTVEIIQRGVHPISLYYMESRHLNLINNHPDSLNAVFSCSRPKSTDYHHCDAKVENGQLILFNNINGNVVRAASIRSGLPAFKEQMNANSNPSDYKKYIGSLMQRDYYEDSPYLTNEQKSERLKRISSYLLGR